MRWSTGRGTRTLLPSRSRRSSGLMRIHATEKGATSTGRPLNSLTCTCSASGRGWNVIVPLPMTTRAVMPAGVIATNASPVATWISRSSAVRRRLSTEIPRLGVEGQLVQAVDEREPVERDDAPWRVRQVVESPQVEAHRRDAPGGLGLAERLDDDAEAGARLNAGEGSAVAFLERGAQRVGDGEVINRRRDRLVCDEGSEERPQARRVAAVDERFQPEEEFGRRCDVGCGGRARLGSRLDGSWRTAAELTGSPTRHSSRRVRRMKCT